MLSWTHFFSVLSGVLATLICYLFKRAYIYVKTYRNSEYSGTWTDEIFEKGKSETVIKRDEFKIKHNKRNHTIEGTIKRIFPVEQNHRAWHSNGVIDGRYFILSFWSADMQKSNGCIYAKLIDDYEYKGYYLEEHADTIDMTPITIKKSRERRR